MLSLQPCSGNANGQSKFADLNMPNTVTNDDQLNTPNHTILNDSEIKNEDSKVEEDAEKKKALKPSGSSNSISDAENSSPTKNPFTNPSILPKSLRPRGGNKKGFLGKSSKKKATSPISISRNSEASQKARQRFIRAFKIIRVMLALNKISEDIQTYGTSSNLFDLTTRDRSTVKKILYPLVEMENGHVSKANAKLPFPLIHPKSYIRLIWTPILVFLLLYTATLMPYMLVFYDETESDWTDGWYCFGQIMDLLFWVDMFINLLSSYYDDEGVLVVSRKIVVMSYLKGWFFIDFFACFPFDLIGDLILDMERAKSKKIQLIRLSRLPRLYRLIKITKIAKVFRMLSSENSIVDFFEFNSGLTRLLTLFFTVSIGIHLMGCLWYYEAKLEDFSPDTWVYRMDMVDYSNLSIYLASIYYALTTLTTVGYGDIHAKTNTEIITSIIWMLFGVGFYSFTIGILSSVLSFIDTKSTSLQKKIAIMNEFCNEMKIEKSLKEKLRKTLEYNAQKNSFTWAEKTNIFNDLPINLRYEIVMNVHNKAIYDLLFFRNCEDKNFVVKAVSLLKPLLMQEKEEIWTTGTNPDAIYFLVSGRVNLITTLDTNKVPVNQSTLPDSSKDEKKKFIFKSMVSGSYFGEIEIILKRRRDYDAVCEVECELYYLSRYDFENVLSKEFPHVADEMKRTAKKREKINVDSVQEIANLLKTAKKLTTVPELEEKSLAQSHDVPLVNSTPETDNNKSESPRNFTEAAADTLKSDEFPKKRSSTSSKETIISKKRSLMDDIKRISLSKEVVDKLEKKSSFSRDSMKGSGDTEELSNLRKYAEGQFSKIMEEMQDSERRTSALEEKMQTINRTLTTTMKLVKDLVAKKRAET